MPKTADPKRYLQLLRGYLTKTGRKQRELAAASHVTESMLSKVLKGKAQPNPANFRKFQAAFLVANGGITQARQVREMAALLGDDLGEDDLAAIAKAVEHFKDPELDSVHFRDRAEAFRATIPAALSSTENNATAEPAAVDHLGAVAPPAVVDLQAEAIPEVGPEQSMVVSENVPADVPTVVAAWQAVLRDLIPPEPVDTLEPDEVIAAVLDWESGAVDPEGATRVWDHVGTPAAMEPFRQRARLDFFLQHLDAETTWNHLEWQWLNHVLVETAQRQAGGSQLSPSQLMAFVIDLGRVAFEAVKASDVSTPDLEVNLAELAGRLPMAEATSWNWLSHIGQTGMVRLSVSPAGICRFASREEAEFLAAQFLINSDDESLLGIARNCGRPFGVLWQAVRSLHFAGRDVAVVNLIKELRHVPEDIPLRDADAAHLLAGCEAPAIASLKAIWQSVQTSLCLLWWMIREPEYRTYIARALRDPDRTKFRDLVQGTLGAEWEEGRPSDSILRSLALLGGEGTVETLWTLTQKPVPPDVPGQTQLEPWNPLQAVLAVATDLVPSEQITLLERLALGATEFDGRRRAVQALAEVGSIPAIRALDRIAASAIDPALARYAEMQRMDLGSPAHAALVARELDEAVADGEQAQLARRTHTAGGLLGRSRSSLSPVLARSLARVWARPDLAEEARIAAILGLAANHAVPALEICLSTLPLADAEGTWESDMLARLLFALSAPAAAPRLWPLVDRAASPAQRAILIRCLGRAGGMALDERFERLLVGPSESVAVAAISALADALGPAAADRLVQIAAGDGRPIVQTAAKEALAEIGSERALPYLREKLLDPNQHADACRQLARLHQPEAETLLVQAVTSVPAGLARDHVYVPALAQSGGAAAVQALRDLLGPEPDEMTLGPLTLELPPDTVTRAPDVWRRLVDDASPDWRMTAVAVMVRDPSQSLIELVVRVAVEGIDWSVREHARNRLQRDVPKIVSPAATEYVLDQLEQQVAKFGQPATFLLEVLQKCLSGLSTDNQELPPDIARRALAILSRILSRVRPNDECFIPLLVVFGYPEFRAAAGELEPLLGTITDAAMALQVLETLIAMQAPGLPNVLMRLAKSARWPALHERASEYLAEVAYYDGLARPQDGLKHLAYRVAILKGIRFRRDGLRHKVILANGATYVRPAQ